MTDTTVPKCISEALEQVSKNAKAIRSLTPLAQFGESLIERFKDTPGTHNWRISADEILGITIRVIAEDISSLIPARQFIRQNGFNAPHIDDYPQLKEKDWIYRKDGNTGTLRLSFNESSEVGAICKFVKVGTEEKDVYELQCNGQAIAQEA